MQVATTIDVDGESGMVVKRLSVPMGLEELMESLTKQILLKKPKDIYTFASEYFAHLLALRDQGKLLDANLAKSSQTMKKQTSKEKAETAEKNAIKVKSVTTGTKFNKLPTPIIFTNSKTSSRLTPQAFASNPNRVSRFHSEVSPRSEKSKASFEKQSHLRSSSSDASEKKYPVDIKRPGRRARWNKDESTNMPMSSGSTDIKDGGRADVKDAAEPRWKPTHRGKKPPIKKNEEPQDTQDNIKPKDTKPPISKEAAPRISRRSKLSPRKSDDSKNKSADSKNSTDDQKKYKSKLSSKTKSKSDESNLSKNSSAEGPNIIVQGGPVPTTSPSKTRGRKLVKTSEKIKKSAVTAAVPIAAAAAIGGVASLVKSNKKPKPRKDVPTSNIVENLVENTVDTEVVADNLESNNIVLETVKSQTDGSVDNLESIIDNSENTLIDIDEMNSAHEDAAGSLDIDSSVDNLLTTEAELDSEVQRLENKEVDEIMNKDANSVISDLIIREIHEDESKIEPTSIEDDLNTKLVENILDVEANVDELENAEMKTIHNDIPGYDEIENAFVDDEDKQSIRSHNLNFVNDAVVTENEDAPLLPEVAKSVIDLDKAAFDDDANIINAEPEITEESHNIVNMDEEIKEILLTDAKENEIIEENEKIKDILLSETGSKDLEDMPKTEDDVNDTEDISLTMDHLGRDYIIRNESINNPEIDDLKSEMLLNATEPDNIDAADFLDYETEPNGLNQQGIVEIIILNENGEATDIEEVNTTTTHISEVPAKFDDEGPLQLEDLSKYLLDQEKNDVSDNLITDETDNKLDEETQEIQPFKITDVGKELMEQENRQNESQEFEINISDTKESADDVVIITDEVILENLGNAETEEIQPFKITDVGKELMEQENRQNESQEYEINTSDTKESADDVVKITDEAILENLENAETEEIQPFKITDVGKELMEQENRQNESQEYEINTSDTKESADDVVTITDEDILENLENAETQEIQPFKITDVGKELMEQENRQNESQEYEINTSDSKESADDVLKITDEAILENLENAETQEIQTFKITDVGKELMEQESRQNESQEYEINTSDTKESADDVVKITDEAILENLEIAETEEIQPFKITDVGKELMQQENIQNESQEYEINTSDTKESADDVVTIADEAILENLENAETQEIQPFKITDVGKELTEQENRQNESQEHEVNISDTKQSTDDVVNITDEAILDILENADTQEIQPFKITDAGKELMEQESQEYKVYISDIEQLTDDVVNITDATNLENLENIVEQETSSEISEPSNKFDISKLREELDEASTLKKHKAVKISYNPHILRHEIRAASKDESEEETVNSENVVQADEIDEENTGLENTDVDKLDSIAMTKNFVETEQAFNQTSDVNSPIVAMQKLSDFLSEERNDSGTIEIKNESIVDSLSETMPGVQEDIGDEMSSTTENLVDEAANNIMKIDNQVDIFEEAGSATLAGEESKLSEDIENKVDALESTVGTGITEADSEMISLDDKVVNDLDTVHQSIEDSIDALEDQTESKIISLEDKVVADLDTVHQSAEDSIGALKDQTGAKSKSSSSAKDGFMDEAENSISNTVTDIVEDAKNVLEDPENVLESAETVLENAEKKINNIEISVEENLEETKQVLQDGIDELDNKIIDESENLIDDSKNHIVDSDNIDDTEDNEVMKELENPTEVFGQQVKPNIPKREEVSIFPKESAATKIQSVWRGHKFRKQYREDQLKMMQKPTECDELPYQRGFNGDDSTNAAIVIQAFLRGYLVRKELKNAQKPDNIKKENSLDILLEEDEAVNQGDHNKEDSVVESVMATETESSTDGVDKIKLSDQEVSDALKILDNLPIPSDEPEHAKTKRSIEENFPVKIITKSVTVDEPDFKQENYPKLTRSTTFDMKLNEIVNEFDFKAEKEDNPQLVTDATENIFKDLERLNKEYDHNVNKFDSSELRKELEEAGNLNNVNTEVNNGDEELQNNDVAEVRENKIAPETCREENNTQDSNMDVGEVLDPLPITRNLMEYERNNSEPSSGLVDCDLLEKNKNERNLEENIEDVVENIEKDVSSKTIVKEENIMEGDGQVLDSSLITKQFMEYEKNNYDSSSLVDCDLLEKNKIEPNLEENIEDVVENIEKDVSSKTIVKEENIMEDGGQVLDPSLITKQFMEYEKNNYDSSSLVDCDLLEKNKTEPNLEENIEDVVENIEKDVSSKTIVKEENIKKDDGEVLDALLITKHFMEYEKNNYESSSGMVDSDLLQDNIIEPNTEENGKDILNDVVENIEKHIGSKTLAKDENIKEDDAEVLDALLITKHFMEYEKNNYEPSSGIVDSDLLQDNIIEPNTEENDKDILNDVVENIEKDISSKPIVKDGNIKEDDGEVLDALIITKHFMEYEKNNYDPSSGISDSDFLQKSEPNIEENGKDVVENIEKVVLETVKEENIKEDDKKSIMGSLSGAMAGVTNYFKDKTSSAKQKLSGKSKSLVGDANNDKKETIDNIIEDQIEVVNLSSDSDNFLSLTRSFVENEQNNYHDNTSLLVKPDELNDTGIVDNQETEVSNEVIIQSDDKVGDPQKSINLSDVQVNYDPNVEDVDYLSLTRRFVENEQTNYHGGELLSVASTDHLEDQDIVNKEDLKKLSIIGGITGAITGATAYIKNKTNSAKEKLSDTSETSKKNSAVTVNEVGEIDSVVTEDLQKLDQDTNDEINKLEDTKETVMGSISTKLSDVKKYFKDKTSFSKELMPDEEKCTVDETESSNNFEAKNDINKEEVDENLQGIKEDIIENPNTVKGQKESIISNISGKMSGVKKYFKEKTRSTQENIPNEAVKSETENIAEKVGTEELVMTHNLEDSEQDIIDDTAKLQDKKESIIENISGKMSGVKKYFKDKTSSSKESIPDEIKYAVDETESGLGEIKDYVEETVDYNPECTNQDIDNSNEIKKESITDNISGKMSGIRNIKTTSSQEALKTDLVDGTENINTFDTTIDTENVVAHNFEDIEPDVIDTTDKLQDENESIMENISGKIADVKRYFKDKTSAKVTKSDETKDVFDKTDNTASAVTTEVNKDAELMNRDIEDVKLLTDNTTDIIKDQIESIVDGKIGKIADVEEAVDQNIKHIKEDIINGTDKIEDQNELVQTRMSDVISSAEAQLENTKDSNNVNEEVNNDNIDDISSKAQENIMEQLDESVGKKEEIIENVQEIQKSVEDIQNDVEDMEDAIGDIGIIDADDVCDAVTHNVEDIKQTLVDGTNKIEDKKESIIDSITSKMADVKNYFKDKTSSAESKMLGQLENAEETEETEIILNNVESKVDNIENALVPYNEENINACIDNIDDEEESVLNIIKDAEMEAIEETEIILDTAEKNEDFKDNINACIDSAEDTIELTNIIEGTEREDTIESPKLDDIRNYEEAPTRPATYDFLSPLSLANLANIKPSIESEDSSNLKENQNALIALQQDFLFNEVNSYGKITPVPFEMSNNIVNTDSTEDNLIDKEISRDSTNSVDSAATVVLNNNYEEFGSSENINLEENSNELIETVDKDTVNTDTVNTPNVDEDFDKTIIGEIIESDYHDDYLIIETTGFDNYENEKVRRSSLKFVANVITAATKIQSIYRGYSVRNKKNKKVVTIGEVTEISDNNNELNEENMDKNEIFSEVIAKIEAEQNKELEKIINASFDSKRDLVELKNRENLSTTDSNDLSYLDITLAALKIQKLFKGYKVRKEIKNNLKKLDDSAEIISNNNGIDSEALNLILEKTGEKSLADLVHAATIIQKAFKNYKKKAEQQKIIVEKLGEEKTNDAATTIQKSFKGYKVRKELEAAKLNKLEAKTNPITTMTNAAITIQKYFKGYKVRRKLLLSKKTIKENKLINGKRKNEAQLKVLDSNVPNTVLAAIKIQKAFKEFKVRRKIKEENILTKDDVAKNIDADHNNLDYNVPNAILAAVTIQSAFKGFKVRKSLKEGHIAITEELDYNLPNAIEASIAIQSAYKGYKTRKDLKEKKFSKTAQDELDALNQSEEDSQAAKNHESITPNTGLIEDEKVVDTENIDDNKSTAEDLAATKIQKVYKGYRVRRSPNANIVKDVEEDTDILNYNIPNVVEACIKIQSAYKGYKLRKDLKENQPDISDNKNGKNLQEKIISKTAQNELDALNQSEEDSQAAKNQENITLNAGLIEDENVVDAEDVDDNKSTAEDLAATKIQKVYKGYRVRRSPNENIVKDDVEEEDTDILDYNIPNAVEASIKIQSAYKGYKVRKNLKENKPDISDDKNRKDLKENIISKTAQDELDVLNKSEDDSQAAKNQENITSNTGFIEDEKIVDAENVDENKSTAEDAAATKIQKVYKGYRVRRNPNANIVKDVEEDTDILNYNIPNAVEASIKIQSAYKGYKARKNLKENKLDMSDDKAQTDMETVDSSDVPNHTTQDIQADETTKISTEDSAATKIQKVFKGYRVRRSIKENMVDDLEADENMLDYNIPNAVEASIKIQSAYKGYKVRKNAKENKLDMSDDKAQTDMETVDSSDVPNHTTQDILGRETTKISTEDSAATKIQKVYKGYRVRRSPKDNIVDDLERDGNILDYNIPKAVDAANKIQSAYKGYKVRKNLKENKLGISDDTTQTDLKTMDTSVGSELRDIEEHETKNISHEDKEIYAVSNESSDKIIPENEDEVQVAYLMNEDAKKDVGSKIEQENNQDQDTNADNADNEEKCIDSKAVHINKWPFLNLEDLAAIRIQKVYKGYTVRKNLKLHEVLQVLKESKQKQNEMNEKIVQGGMGNVNNTELSIETDAEKEVQNDGIIKDNTVLSKKDIVEAEIPSIEEFIPENADFNNENNKGVVDNEMITGLDMSLNKENCVGADQGEVVAEHSNLTIENNKSKILDNEKVFLDDASLSIGNEIEAIEREESENHRHDSPIGANNDKLISDKLDIELPNWRNINEDIKNKKQNLEDEISLKAKKEVSEVAEVPEASLVSEENKIELPKWGQSIEDVEISHDKTVTISNERGELATEVEELELLNWANSDRNLINNSKDGDIKSTEKFIDLNKTTKDNNTALIENNTSIEDVNKKHDETQVAINKTDCVDFKHSSNNHEPYTYRDKLTQSTLAAIKIQRFFKQYKTRKETNNDDDAIEKLNSSESSMNNNDHNKSIINVPVNIDYSSNNEQSIPVHSGVTEYIESLLDPQINLLDKNETQHAMDMQRINKDREINETENLDSKNNLAKTKSVPKDTLEILVEIDGNPDIINENTEMKQDIYDEVNTFDDGNLAATKIQKVYKGYKVRKTKKDVLNSNKPENGLIDNKIIDSIIKSVEINNGADKNYTNAHLAKLKEKSEEIEQKVKSSIEDLENLSNEIDASNQKHEPFFLHAQNTIHDNPIAAAIRVSSRNTSQEPTIGLLHSGEIHDATFPLSFSPTNIQVLVQDHRTSSRNSGPPSTPMLVHSSEMHDVLIPQHDATGAPAGATAVTSASVREKHSAAQSQAASINRDGSARVPVRRGDSVLGMEEKRNNATITTNTEENMESQAATKIQASFRGYQVRKQMKPKNADITTPRRSSRRKSTGKLVDSNKPKQDKKGENELEERSATKIQAGIRGFLVRRRHQNKSNKKDTPESS